MSFNDLSLLSVTCVTSLGNKARFETSSLNADGGLRLYHEFNDRSRAGGEPLFGSVIVFFTGHGARTRTDLAY